MDQEYFSCSSVVYLLMTTVNLSANEQFEILSSQICTLDRDPATKQHIK